MSNLYVARSGRTETTCEHKTRRVKSRGLCGSCYNRALKDGSIKPLTSDICPSCKVALKAISNSGRKHGSCLDCKRSSEAKWRTENPERWAIHQKRARLKRLFGMTLEQFDEMFTEQCGQCSICKQELSRELPNGPNKTCIDHDHTSGKVRSLLCNLCNIGLGSMRDNPELLIKAAKYLESYK